MTDTLDIQQPQPYDLVDAHILIAGNATAFEGSMRINVEEGHDAYSSFAQVGSLGLRQFQAHIDIPENNAFKSSKLFLTLSDDSGNENGPKVSFPILYGPLILPGYRGWQPYTVQPGDTLSSIARKTYGKPDFHPIFEANQNILSNPDIIHPGQVLRIPRNDL